MPRKRTTKGGTESFGLGNSPIYVTVPLSREDKHRLSRLCNRRNLTVVELLKEIIEEGVRNRVAELEKAANPEPLL